jgi:hypothetical protein
LTKEQADALLLVLPGRKAYSVGGGSFGVTLPDGSVIWDVSTTVRLKAAVAKLGLKDVIDSLKGSEGSIDELYKNIVPVE